MEYYLDKDYTETSKSIEIIGNEESQVLQVVLKRNDSVIINRAYLSYVSSTSLEEIPYLDSVSPIQKEQPKESTLKRTKSNEFLKLKNINDNFEYVGITKCGQIMKIIPALYSNLFIRANAILAFSDNLDLMEDSSINQQLYSPSPIKIKIPLKGSNMLDNYYLKVEPLNKNILGEDTSLGEIYSAFKLNSMLKEYLYISAEKCLIEKRLGANEQIVLLKNSIIAFESSVQFIKLSQKAKFTFVNYNEDIIVEGPGLVIYEPKTRQLTGNINTRYTLFLAFGLLALEVIIQVFLASFGLRVGH